MIGIWEFAVGTALVGIVWVALFLLAGIDLHVVMIFAALFSGVAVLALVAIRRRSIVIRPADNAGPAKSADASPNQTLPRETGHTDSPVPPRRPSGRHDEHRTRSGPAARFRR
jgi:hypothetical protein